jgi:UDP-N-acetylmuramoylalanine--D-glutamate ligase
MSKYLVVGAGKSGVAAANFLAARSDQVSIADSNREPVMPQPLDARVTRFFGDDSGALDGVNTVVLSPGVPAAIPLVQHAREQGIAVIAEVELAFRHLKGKVVGITGSNGKSTTTALIGEIFKAAGREPIVAGNIGEPLISSIDTTRERAYVIELSSFQLETIETFRPDVALLLNITPDHMDRYSSFEAYAAAKYRIFENQRGGDTAIVNADERRAPTIRPGVRTWAFSSLRRLDSGAYVSGDHLVLCVDDRESRIPRAALKLEGTANVENALAAWLAARALDVDDSAVRSAFESFAGLPHRMVLVREMGGVRFVNDSKGTNVDATLKSLEGFDPKAVVLILGGKDKAGEFERMRDVVRDKARVVITIGAAADRIGSALNGSVQIVPMQTMERAIEWASKNARKGETVLLSPACASFDQYRNFEHRGQHFEELVRAL